MYFIAIFIVIYFIDLCMPIELVSSNGAMYSSGMAVTFVYIISAMASFYCALKFVLNLKTIKKKKNIPLIAYIIGTGVTAVIQQRFLKDLLYAKSRGDKKGPAFREAVF